MERIACKAGEKLIKMLIYMILSRKWELSILYIRWLWRWKSENFSSKIYSKNVISKSSIDYNGNRVQKDQYGNVEYKYSKDYNGNIVVKDQYGNKIGTYKTDYNGNVVFHPEQRYWLTYKK